MFYANSTALNIIDISNFNKTKEISSIQINQIISIIQSNNNSNILFLAI